jgi:hypothetical protein
MPWWLWTILGAIAYLAVLLIAYSLVRASSDEDEKRGYK